MKNFIKLLFAAICFMVLSTPVVAQVANRIDRHHEHKDAEGHNIDKFLLPLDFDADSLVGFDESAAWEQARMSSNEEWRQQRIVAILKRNFIDFHYNLKVAAGPNPGVQAPCTNPGFEDGTLTGWTAMEGDNNNSLTMAGCCPAATSQAIIVGAGFDPNLGGTILSQVPPGGGNFACRLGQTGTGGKSYRLNQTFTVTATNSVFIYRYAVVLEDGSHNCNEQPFFNVRFETCNNVVIPCAQYNVVAGGSLCSGGDPSFISSGAYNYLPWQTRSFDLTAYIGQCVNIEFTVGGCVKSQGAHAGYAYIDAQCQPMTLNLNGTDIPVGQTTTNMCASVTNTLCAPPGFTSYSWNGPGVTGNTNQCITTSTSGTYSVTLGMAGSSCNSPVLYSNFNIVPKPIANFNFATTPCTSTFTVPFTDATSQNGGPAITNYYWDFDGNGSVDNLTQNPTNTYSNSGTYNVELKVSNGGCTDSITKVVTITPAPTANFTVSNACLNSATTFTATSTPTTGIASHAWDFGEGPNGSGANPSHTYSTAGVKNITYTVTNTSGCSGVVTKTVTVFPNPVMAITANTVCLNVPTTFGNTSSVAAPDNISSWAWDFDNNGVVDNGTQSPTNTYTAPGNYTAVLTATTNNGCVNSTSIGVKVNALPTATFTPVNACLNTNVALNNTSSVPAPDNISNYSWNFGVGANPATANGVTANPTPLVYSSSGIKNITLNITANTSCTASITQTVMVYPQPVANFSTTSVCQSTATAFTDLSTPTGSITNWAWDYTKDGTIDNTTNAPTNVYASSGTFSASLIVTDNNSCKDTVVLPVNVWGHAIPDFTSTTVCFNVATTFSNTTNTTSNANVGGVSGWSWEFGDGATSSVQNPSYTYTTPLVTSYSATLTATTINGCVDSVTKTVNVHTLPTATFTPVNACMNSNVLLNNTSSIPLPDNIASYSWNFGTGAAPATTSSVQNPPVLTYPSSGVKTITLFITSNTTCTATITQTVDIYPQPVANFSTTSVCQSTATAFTDLSTTSVGTITNWAWDYTSNSSIDNTTNAPTNVFTSSGTFTTTLIVTTSNGCKDTVLLPVDVWGHTIPDFSPDKVCFGTSSAFTNLTDDTTNPNVGVGTTYSWNFGDATAISNATAPSHAYTLGGNANATYTVTLVSTSFHGCADSLKKVVNVYALPTASFTSNKVCLGVASTLTDASNGNGNTVNTYAWDFLSDGTVDASGVANPNYTFPNFGNNNVSYTVSTSPVTGLICSNSTSTIQVWVDPLPVPDFTFVNKCINAQPNTFNASSSIIAIGTNTAYAWAYGDGQTAAPIASSTSSHVYTAAGIYNTTLTVTSDKGCQQVVVKQVEVYEKPHMIITNSPACDQKVMTFTAVAQPNSGVVTSWYWDMNNSVSTIEANGQTVSYTFAGPGAHAVTLVSETAIGGCRDTLVKPIYVNYVPVANFVADTLKGCPHPNFCVQFTDLSPAITGPAQIAQWQWTFGDGTNVINNTNRNVGHCYTNTSSNQVATFDVSLQLVSDSGCVSAVNTKPAYITVYPTPIANYTVTPNPGNVLTPLVYFINQSVDYTKWWWSFGDGPFNSDSVNVNPTHFYSDETAQIYNSHLIVANQYGCKDTAYVLVEIGPEFTFYIPNAFTPANEDNINDVFTGKGIGIVKYEMWIFDRWGANIFYTDDIVKGWNGKVQGKSQEVQQDVYIWKVKLLDVLGKKHDYIGH
ncbi:MAG: PKD domain-containing protein, partial [Bacteroidetes bacterium]|nr:PKD domain-containing protein [Bacteroidota bacterium]